MNQHLGIHYLDGVKDNFLINPTTIDARTEITTQLLSDDGYSMITTNDENGEEVDTTYRQRDFEKKFFSDITNRVLCKTLLDNALKDPITGEIGKSLVFCVSQKHAVKVTQILNELATEMFPGNIILILQFRLLHGFLLLKRTQ